MIDVFQENVVIMPEAPNAIEIKTLALLRRKSRLLYQCDYSFNIRVDAWYRIQSSAIWDSLKECLNR
jgi:hypothetical protein